MSRYILLKQCITVAILSQLIVPISAVIVDPQGQSDHYSHGQSDESELDSGEKFWDTSEETQKQQSDKSTKTSPEKAPYNFATLKEALKNRRQKKELEQEELISKETALSKESKTYFLKEEGEQQQFKSKLAAFETAFGKSNANYLSYGKSHMFDSVGKIESSNGDQCTATIIHIDTTKRQLIGITAAHCISMSESTFYFDSDIKQKEPQQTGHKILAFKPYPDYGVHYNAHDVALFVADIHYSAKTEIPQTYTEKDKKGWSTLQRLIATHKEILKNEPARKLNFIFPKIASPDMYAEKANIRKQLSIKDASLIGVGFGSLGHLTTKKDVPAVYTISSPSSKLAFNTKLSNEFRDYSSTNHNYIIATDDWLENYIVTKRIKEENMFLSGSVASGDSGGPLFIKDNNGNLVLIGIASAAGSSSLSAHQSFYSKIPKEWMNPEILSATIDELKKFSSFLNENSLIHFNQEDAVIKDLLRKDTTSKEESPDVSTFKTCAMQLMSGRKWHPFNPIAYGYINQCMKEFSIPISLYPIDTIVDLPYKYATLFSLDYPSTKELIETEKDPSELISYLSILQDSRSLWNNDDNLLELLQMIKGNIKKPSHSLYKEGSFNLSALIEEFNKKPYLSELMSYYGGFWEYFKDQGLTNDVIRALSDHIRKVSQKERISFLNLLLKKIQIFQKKSLHLLKDLIIFASNNKDRDLKIFLELLKMHHKIFEIKIDDSQTVTIVFEDRKSQTF